MRSIMIFFFCILSFIQNYYYRQVGVVGRTGAGKSSLISALFRLAPIDGHVIIDDVDTGEISLEEISPRISFIHLLFLLIIHLKKIGI